mgnify:CR=1 FL=1
MGRPLTIGFSFWGFLARHDDHTEVETPDGLRGERAFLAEELLLPREVKFGEPFNARVVAWSQRDTGARIALYRNGEFIGSQNADGGTQIDQTMQSTRRRHRRLQFDLRKS